MTRALTFEHEIACDHAPGDRVWVNAFELARGRARGTVLEVTPHDYAHMEGAHLHTLRIYDVLVRLDAPAHVPRYAYRTYDSIRSDWRRLVEWPGATEITVPPHALDAL